MKTSPQLVALLLFLTAIALYVAAVGPLSTALTKARAELANDQTRLSTMQMDISMQPEIKKRIAELEAKNERHRAEWIAPMLNSYAMRAKSFLDAAATESGLANVEYNEGAFRALPVPKILLPDQRTARRSVRVKAMADYAAAASFLMRAERDLPALCLQSLTIEQARVSGASADRQEVEMVFEWPCEGEVIK